MTEPEFRTGVIRPIECVREAWELIKDDYWILFAISLVGALIGGVTLYVMIGAMVCGIFYSYLKKIDGQKVVFDDLFVGFKYFWQSLGVTIAIVFPLVAWMIILFVTIYLPIITAAVMGQKANDRAILGSFIAGFTVDIVVALIMMTVHSLLIFCFPLIVDREMSSWDSMKLSSRAVMKNFGGITGLIGVNFGLVLVGYAGCGVGLYFMIPVITATNLVAYRQVFPKLGDRRYDPPPPGAYQGVSN